MLKVTEFTEPESVESRQILRVELSFDMRKRGRFRAETICGKELGFFLERGNALKAGDTLKAETGELIVIDAAIEEVSVVTANDELTLLKAAYHLGNRHTPLEVYVEQIGGGDSQKLCHLKYLQDYVLDDMVAQLGARVVHKSLPFHPESGAYGRNGKIAGGHSHGADKEHHHHG